MKTIVSAAQLIAFIAWLPLLLRKPRTAFVSYIAKHRWPWGILFLWMTLAMDPLRIFFEPQYFSRYGGMISLVGLLLLTSAQAKVDMNSEPTKISDEPLYKAGFLVAALGTILWACGDVYLEWALRFFGHK